MSREFPDFIDPWKAADGRREFQGTMPLNRMRRLVDLLAPADAAIDGITFEQTDASFRARFRHDEQGLVIVELRVRADLPLICQRDLQPYLERVDRSSTLAMISEMAQEELLPESYDPVLVEHSRVALQDLVEDELLLGVPQVPRNPATAEIELSTDGKAPAPPEPEKEKTHRPFEGLAGLLKEIED